MFAKSFDELRLERRVRERRHASDMRAREPQKYFCCFHHWGPNRGATRNIIKFGRKKNTAKILWKKFRHKKRAAKWKSFVVLYDFFNDFIHFYKVNFLRPTNDDDTTYRRMAARSFVACTRGETRAHRLKLCKISRKSVESSWKRFRRWDRTLCESYCIDIFGYYMACPAEQPSCPREIAITTAIHRFFWETLSHIKPSGYTSKHIVSSSRSLKRVNQLRISAEIEFHYAQRDGELLSRCPAVRKSWYSISPCYRTRRMCARHYTTNSPNEISLPIVMSNLVKFVRERAAGPAAAAESNKKKL